MEAKFTFHPVGQGLFYSGQLKDGNHKPFNFVYDCGKLGFQTGISQFVKSYLKNDNINHLDLFILSHFHWDHFNGLKEIMSIKNGIHTIILPYLAPIQRLAIALSDLRHPKWYFDFLINPVKYINDYNLCVNRQIVFVSYHYSNNNSENAKGKDSEFDMSYWNDNKTLEKIIKENDPDFFKQNNVFCKTIEGFARVKNEWDFHFYNKEVNDLYFNIFKNDILAIAKKIKKDINGNFNEFINRIISTPNNRKDFKSVYKKLAEYLEDDINNTSLVVYHAPKQNTKNNTVTGQFLTGDISFKNCYLSDISNHFSSFLSNIFVFQIPHHGSIHNWNNYIIKNFNRAKCFIASGQHKGWEHPHPFIKSYLNDKKNDRVFLNCNEGVCDYSLVKMEEKSWKWLMEKKFKRVLKSK